jgi:hypothetical protein
MLHRTKRKLAALAAVAVFLAGGTLVAMAATGHGDNHTRARGATARHVVRSELARAAGYLGLSTAALQADLRSGKTLAQVADATAGKSEAGLVEALVAARRAKLHAQAARLPRAVRAAVNRPGGPAAPALGTLYDARVYLGLSAPQLGGGLRAGKTLAQIADATPGKSQAGLIEALVNARKELLADAVANGKLSSAQERKRTAKLVTRVTALVDRTWLGRRRHSG